MHKILKNKKGFTLIELLAVIVILAILMLFAGSNVMNVMNNARKNSFRSEFLSLLETTEIDAQQDQLYGNALTTTGTCKCYCIGDGCTDNLVTSFDNTSGYTGSVLVKNTGDGTLTYEGWMYSKSYQIVDKFNSLTTDDVKDYAGSGDIQNCNNLCTNGKY